MADNTLNVLSDDLGWNVKLVQTSSTVVVLGQRIGMPGEFMPGSSLTLGGAYSETYLGGIRNIRRIDSSLYVKRI
jgi:hypothetical protein